MKGRERAERGAAAAAGIGGCQRIRARSGASRRGWVRRDGVGGATGVQRGCNGVEHRIHRGARLRDVVKV